MKQYSIITFLILTALCCLFFLPFLGAVHLFDWDEINFAEAAREMLVSGNWATVTINFEPFWEKPPLFIWMQALSMKLWGVNEFAARFPSILSAIVTINLIYYIGVKHFRSSIAQGWVLAYFAALTPHFYFKTGLIDPTFNLFIFWAIYQLAIAYDLHQKKINNTTNLLWASLLIGIAVLVKGPVAIAIFLLVLLLMTIANRKFFYSLSSILLGIAVTTAVVSIWFLPETIKNGPWFIERFIVYQIELFSQNVAGHQQPFYYHPLVLFFGCFPISVIAVKAMRLNITRHREKPYFTTFHILFWVVLILFSIVKTKIVHYSSLCWLPLTFLAAYWIDHAMEQRHKLGKLGNLFFLISALPLVALQIVLPVLLFTGQLANVTRNIKDEFAKAIINTPSLIQQWQLVLIALLGVVMLILVLRTILNFKNINSLLVFCTLNLFAIAAILVPIVDGKLQKPLFSFYKSIADKDAYVETMHFKSYAHYFYAKVKPLNENTELVQLNKRFLAGKNIQDLNQDSFKKLKELQLGFYRDAPRDKPVYMVYKTNYRPLPKAEEGVFFLGDYGAYKVFLRPKRKE